MLAILQSALCYGEVVVPVSCDIDEIYVVALAELFLGFFAEVDVSGLQSSVAELSLALFSACFFIVAKSNDLYTGDVSETLNSPRATCAKTYETYAYSLELGSCEAECVLLTEGTLGSLNHDSTILPVPCGTVR